jgi:predicted ABC-type ATPase
MSLDIFVIGGPNGAGKSTLAPLLLRDRLHLRDFVNADTIALGLSAFSPESAAIEAGRVMLKRLDELAAQPTSFAFETTLATRSYAPRLARWQKAGFTIHVIFLWLRDVELAIKRVETRVRMGGHAIEPETIRRRYRRGLDNFKKLYQPVADRWAVIENTDTNQPMIIAQGGPDDPTEIIDPDGWSVFLEQTEETK